MRPKPRAKPHPNPPQRDGRIPSLLEGIRRRLMRIFCCCCHNGNRNEELNPGCIYRNNIQNCQRKRDGMPDGECRDKHEDFLPIGIDVSSAKREQKQHVIITVEVGYVLKSELEVGWEHYSNKIFALYKLIYRNPDIQVARKKIGLLI
jgi:hypothetical protein